MRAAIIRRADSIVLHLRGGVLYQKQREQGELPQET
jgi:hypothetical protein